MNRRDFIQLGSLSAGALLATSFAAHGANAVHPQSFPIRVLM